MSWDALIVAPCGTHHINGLRREPAYAARFDEVWKFHDPGLAPVRRGDAAWHIHVTGEARYERRFPQAFGYYEHRAAVTGVDGWHHILPDGREAYGER